MLVNWRFLASVAADEIAVAEVGRLIESDSRDRITRSFAGVSRLIASQRAMA